MIHTLIHIQEKRFIYYAMYLDIVNRCTKKIKIIYNLKWREYIFNLACTLKHEPTFDTHGITNANSVERTACVNIVTKALFSSKNI
jgi:hypothetical protein